MKNVFKSFSVAILALVLVLSIGADEGMWMPHQMKVLNLKALGLQMDPGDLYREDGTGLMSAVVNLGGGTGEFVSSEGLILTNHHVILRASAIHVILVSGKEYEAISQFFEDANTCIPSATCREVRYSASYRDVCRRQHRQR